MDIIKLNSTNGINVHLLKMGTIIWVVTKNNKYKLTKGFRDKYDVVIRGGRYFKEPTEVNFTGSTFGGSMLKIGWIGYCMHMEMYVPSLKTTITTSSVQEAAVIGNGWEYVFDWKK
jgi:hypothetical protein